MLKRLGKEAVDLARHIFNLMLLLGVGGVIYAITKNATVAAIAALVLIGLLEVLVKRRATRQRARK